MKNRMKHITAVILLIVMAFSMSVSAERLPDGGPEGEEKNYLIFNPNNLETIFTCGLVPSFSNAKYGMYSGLWTNTHKENQTITFKNVPKDWSGYATIEMDIYLEKAMPKDKIGVYIYSPDAPEGIQYHALNIQLTWSGWKHLSYQLVVSDEALGKRRNADLSNVTKVAIGWNGFQNPDGTADEEAYIGNIYLVPGQTSNKPKFFDKETQAQYEEQSNGTVSFYAGSDYACIDGKREKMDAAAIKKDDKIYVPKTFISNTLKLAAPSDVINENGKDYVNASKTLEEDGKYSDTYTNGNFVIAGEDVSAFKEDTELYRCAAYQVCYSTLEEITYDDAVFDEMHKRWRDDLVGTSEEQTTDNEWVKKYSKRIEQAALNSYESTKKDVLEVKTTTDLGSQASGYYTHVSNMAKGYATEGTSTYRSAKLKQQIIYVMDWLYDNMYGQDIVANAHFDAFYEWKGENWFVWQIQIPLDVVNILLIMRDEFTQEQIDKWIAPTNILSAKPFDSGSNKIWIAQIIMAAGVLQKDAEKIILARDAIATEVNYKQRDPNKHHLVDGMYRDGSYFMHQGLGYNLGYALSFFEYLQKIIPVIEGTPFAALDPDIESRNEWIDTVYYPFIYKGIGTVITSGRSYEKSNVSEDIGTRVISNMITFARYIGGEAEKKLKSMIKYQCQNSPLNEKGDYYQQKLGLQSLVYYENLMNDPDVEPVSPGDYSQFFYNMEKGIRHGKDYMFTLNMSSKRIKRYEAFGGDNNRGWYQSDGVTYLHLDGVQRYSGAYYKNIDANKYPGTTVDGATRIARDFDSDVYDVLFGENDFSGGVTLGDGYMTAGIQLIGYQHDGLFVEPFQSTLRAKKSYFTFDDEIIMLGADINSQDNRDVLTVVDNRAMSGFIRESEDSEMTEINVESVTASKNDGNEESNVIDGDLATRWSADGTDEWIQLDLGEPKTVAGIQMAFMSGDKRKSMFDISVSSDGITWKNVYSGESSGTTFELEKYEFHEDNVRYIKLDCHGNSINLWNSITEIEVHSPDKYGKFEPTARGLIYGTENIYLDGVLQTESEYTKTQNGVKYANFADKVGYYIFDGANTTISKTNASSPYMILQINHGKNPAKATYGYAWLPNMTNEETKAYAQNPEFEVISNTEKIQSVTDTDNNVTGYVFWEGTEVNGIGVDKPCIIMTKETADTFEVRISEPTRLSREINFYLNRTDLEVIDTDKTLTVNKSDKTNITLNIDDIDNGETHTIKFKKVG